MKTSLRYLTHRLEWPLCRVRREAAYEIARLVREGVDGAADAILEWISERGLESEASIGISVIHAFELAPHIALNDVIAAIRAPSFLSDWLLQATYAEAPSQSASYGYEPSDDPVGRHRDYFDRNQGQLIALRFRSRLEHLEEFSGLPFYERWFEEWSALQDSVGAPFSGRPNYIWATGAREDMANVQVRQTEVYVSAYLRTLAYASAQWGLPKDRAFNASLEALPFSQGLASVRPIHRPKWSFDSLKLHRAGGVRPAAEKAWRGADRSTSAGQTSLALRTVDHDELSILRLTIRRVLVPEVGGEQPPPSADLRSTPWAMVEAPLSTTGPLGTIFIPRQTSATFLSVHVRPFSFPRLHADILPEGIELANPGLFGETPMVLGTSDSLQLEVGGKPISEWRHWYADWEPTYPREIDDYAGYLTTIDARTLARVTRQSGLVIQTICQADYGVRKYGYDAATFETEQFWL